MPPIPANNPTYSKEDHTENTSDIRRQKRILRKELSQGIQKHNSLALCQNIIKEKTYRNSKSIACYLSNDGEIDPYPIIEHAWFSGKKVFLPVLSPLKKSLYFVPYKIDSKMSINRYNIPEPVCKPSQWRTACQLDLLLLPLVAFDPHGNRIGMGGGFYDRTLAYLQHRQYWKKPALVGLAHEIQQTGKLETQNWDVPLDIIVTEKQRYRT